MIIIDKKRIILNGITTDYIVYDNGSIYSEKSNKFLKPRKCGDYYRVTLFVDCHPYQLSVHRLVAMAFIPNPKLKPHVNHKDGVKTHNDASNLEWCTASENIRHAFATGLKKSKHGDDSHLVKYSRKDVIKACKLMEKGILTLKEISIKTKIEYSMIYLIANHKAWTNVSQYYNIDNYYKKRRYYSYNQYLKVFLLLNENKLSIYEISDITGVSVDAILNVLRHKKNPIYDDLYDEIDISKYTRSGKTYKKIGKREKKYIDKLYSDGDEIEIMIRKAAKKLKINEYVITRFIKKNYD